MGSSQHPRDSKRKTVRKARRSPATPTQPARTKPRIAAAIEIAIDDQRDSLGTAISVLYCLHSTLCYQATGGRSV
jgi:hypothetical protein